MPQEPEYFSKQVTDARRWFLEFPKPGERGVTIISLGCERCLPDYVIERDTFDKEALEFVAEGEGTLFLNGQQHTLRPGSVFTYREDIPHRIVNTSQKPMLKYFLNLGGQKARELIDASTVGGGNIVQVSSVVEIMELFEMLMSNATGDSPYSGSICSSLVETLLLKISEQTIKGHIADSRAWATYQRIRRHMQTHYLRLKTMTQVAEETGVDAAYLSRVFRRFHQSSPYKFLTRLKMGHAASLLLNPDSLVKIVADDLGFEDPFHFSRTFKSIYGISPEQFANRKRK
jgi:AraC-like DNA-binding protein